MKCNVLKFLQIPQFAAYFFLSGQLNFPAIVRPIGQAHICQCLNEAAVHAGHEVLTDTGDNSALIVGNPKGILGQRFSLAQSGHCCRQCLSRLNGQHVQRLHSSTSGYGPDLLVQQLQGNSVVQTRRDMLQTRVFVEILTHYASF